jgi:aminopeptidase N
VKLIDDISFPHSWLQATLGGHQTASAAGTVRAFLQAHPGSNPKHPVALA